MSGLCLTLNALKPGLNNNDDDDDDDDDNGGGGRGCLIVPFFPGSFLYP